MRRLILAFIIGVATSVGVTPNTAHGQDIDVTVKDLDAANPSHQQWWWNIDTGNAKQIVERIVNDVATYYRYPSDNTAAIKLVNATLGIFSEQGEEHVGFIQAPVGYSVCRAYVERPNVSCNGTFNGSYRTANDPQSGKIDGLHWYLVVPRPGNGQGPCWATGTVVVTFVNAIKKAQIQPACHQSGEIAFHYGK